MPILDARSLDFVSHSAEQTRRLGVRLGELLSACDVICLSGDLGSGKTTLVMGIARGWGALDQVTSPTFVLVNQYRRADAAILYHLDAYRLSSPREALDSGLGEVLDGQGDLVVEWPERILAVLPAERLWVNLRWVGEEKRGLRFEAMGLRYERLLLDFKKAAFGC